MDKKRTLKQAAAIIESNAQSLKESSTNTNTGAWDSLDIEREYQNKMRVVRELRIIASVSST